MHRFKASTLSKASRYRSLAPQTPPRVSFSSVPGWQPAHIPQVPAFQAALDFLAGERKRATRSSPAFDTSDAAISQLELQAQLNDPGLREQVSHGLGDMTSEAVVMLVEQGWKKEGRLGQLMEHLHRARIVPDILPSFHPTADLQVHAQIIRKDGNGRKFKKLTPGQPLPIARAVEIPQFTAQVFHQEPSLYTLLLVDLDVPNHISQDFQSFLHFLLVNVQLSASVTDIPVSATASLPYIAPHPAKGSPMHRYVALLLKQDKLLDVDVCSQVVREKFSVRTWLEQLGGHPAGASFWTSVWSNSEADLVSKIYRQRGVHEPQYGLPPRPPSGTNRRRPLARLPLKGSSQNQRVPWDSPDLDFRAPYLVTRTQIAEAKAAENQTV